MPDPVQYIPPGTVVEAPRMAPSQISPKAILAFMLPSLGSLVLVLINEFVTIHMDTTLKLAILGVVNALLAFAGAYAGQPGEVVVGKAAQ